MDLSVILGVLKEGLKLWNTKDSTKYLDRIIKLEKDYNEELSRPENDRSQLFLDQCLHDIRIIAENFIKYASRKQ